MNVIRTIQATEEQWWVDELFVQTGRPGGPAFPIRLPFPHRLHHTVPGETVYLLWKGQIIGYAQIDEIVSHSGDSVGTSDNPVNEGDSLIVNTQFTRWAGPTCRGFQGVRYVGDIHRMTAQRAQREVDAALGL